MFAVGCATGVSDEFETCTIDLTLERAKGAPGDEVVVGGDPLTNDRDTVVEVGGVVAAVTEVVQSDSCAECLSCRSAAGCAPCGLCAGRPLDPKDRVSCFGDPLAGVEGSCDKCEESLTFVVPDVPPGPSTLFVINRNGQSDPVPFEVLAAPVATGP